MAAGLKPMGRNYVHLSVGVEEAKKVALRRTKQLLILKVKAFQANQRGEYIVWENLKKELLVVLENLLEN